MRALRPLLVLASVLSATPSLADLIVPEVEDCRGKQAGDACPGGTCESDGFSCQAGSCRRFDTEAECRADGCQWVEGLSCRAKAPATPTTPAPPSAPASTPTPSPVTAGCSGSPAAWPGSALLVAILLGRRRRPGR